MCSPDSRHARQPEIPVDPDRNPIGQRSAWKRAGDTGGRGYVDGGSARTWMLLHLILPADTKLLKVTFEIHRTQSCSTRRTCKKDGGYVCKSVTYPPSFRHALHKNDRVIEPGSASAGIRAGLVSLSFLILSATFAMAFRHPFRHPFRHLIRHPVFHSSVILSKR